MTACSLELTAWLISHVKVFFSHSKSALVGLSAVKTISRTGRQIASFIEIKKMKKAVSRMVRREVGSCNKDGRFFGNRAS